MPYKTDMVVDALDLLDPFSELEEATDGKMAIDDAFIKCVRRCGQIVLSYICEQSGESAERVVEYLGGKGAMFQDPEEFGFDDEWDIEKGWVLRSRYLTGNKVKKLEEAREADRRFEGRFESNIKALESLSTKPLDTSKIKFNLGATYIPEFEYSRFIYDHLRFSEYHIHELPRVTLDRKTHSWKIEFSNDTKALLATMPSNVQIYGTKRVPAIKNIEQTMNGVTINVFDYTPTYHNWRYDKAFNMSETLLAQEQQKLNINEFRNWIYSDANRLERFIGYYTDAFVGYSFTAYDGEFLSLEDLNPEVELYNYQRSAIARTVLSETNLLLAEDVGSGKTYIMCIGAHELKRLGLSDKILYVVPNNILKATVDTYKYLYPEDKILAIYPKDFTPEHRNEVLCQIRDGDYAVIFMAYSSFDLIVMSKDYWVDNYEREIRELRAAAFNARYSHEKKSYEKKASTLSKKMVKYIEETEECKWLTFDKLGINTLIVDEAHNYKNIPLKSRADNVVGMHTAGSNKCKEMYAKSQYADRLILATGTPLTNSLADLFVFQMYLQREELEFRDIDSFDMWINTFGERETNYEIDVDTNNLRAVTRFTNFHNLTELMSMFSTVCEFHHIDGSENGIPDFDGYTDVLVEMNPAQKQYISSLSERITAIRNREVDRTEDNLLKITVDGRKCGLDVRLVDDEVICDIVGKNKIDICAERILKEYRENPDTAQVVLSDIGTPKARFNVYDALKKRLVERGIPEHEIAFIHDATTEKARTELFAGLNSADIRVVVGSTQKIGVGVNIQERLVALHHLDVPWRPADMVQREGRILRKGNTCEKIRIYRYITRGSFDGYSWQLLETKQRFISKFLSGTSTAQSVEDIADTVLSFAEAKALAIGNPLIKRRVEVANEIERLQIASRKRLEQILELRNEADRIPAEVERLRKLSRIAMTDHELYRADRCSIPNEERIAFGEELLDALAHNIEKTAERVFDEYQGFTVFLPEKMTAEKPFIRIRSRNGGSYLLEMTVTKPLGCSKSIDALLDSLDKRAEKLRVSSENAEQRYNDIYANISKGNTYQSEINAKQAELARIDEELRGDAHKKVG